MWQADITRIQLARISLDDAETICECCPRCAEPAITQHAIDALFSSLREVQRRDSPVDSTLAPAAARTTTWANHDAVDWVGGLGPDIFGAILVCAGVPATGAAAATCRTVREAALLDELWLALVERTFGAAATAAGACGGWRVACRRLWALRQLELGSDRVRSMVERAQVAQLPGRCSHAETLAEARAEAERRLGRVRAGGLNP